MSVSTNVGLGGNSWTSPNVRGNVFYSTSASSNVFTVTRDTCQHCEEKLTPEQVEAREPFCSEACRIAHSVAERLGADQGLGQVTTASWGSTSITWASSTALSTRM